MSVTQVNPYQIRQPSLPTVTWADAGGSGAWSGQIGSRTAEQIYQSGQEQTDIFANDSIQGATSIPDTAVEWEGCGVFGGVENSSTTTNAVAGRFYSLATASGADDANRVKCWAINTLQKDGTASSNYNFVFLLNEYDFNVNNTGTRVIAHSIGGASSVQPAQALGYTVNTLGGAGTSGIKWDCGFCSLDGTSMVGLQLGTLGGDGVSSQPIFMYSRSGGGTSYLHQLQGDASSNFQLTTPGNFQFNAGGSVNQVNITANGIVLSANKYITFGTSATGATTATLGTASPAISATPYVWLKAQSPDGNVVYIPAWR